MSLSDKSFNIGENYTGCKSDGNAYFEKDVAQAVQDALKDLDVIYTDYGYIKQVFQNRFGQALTSPQTSIASNGDTPDSKRREGSNPLSEDIHSDPDDGSIPSAPSVGYGVKETWGVDGSGSGMGQTSNVQKGCGKRLENSQYQCGDKDSFNIVHYCKSCQSQETDGEESFEARISRPDISEQVLKRVITEYYYWDLHIDVRKMIEFTIAETQRVTAQEILELLDSKFNLPSDEEIGDWFDVRREIKSKYLGGSIK